MPIGNRHGIENIIPNRHYVTLRRGNKWRAHKKLELSCTSNFLSIFSFFFMHQAKGLWEPFKKKQEKKIVVITAVEKIKGSQDT